MTGAQLHRLPLHQLFLLAVLIAVAFHQAFPLTTVRELPLGCDDFGYQRQAALFRKNGFAGFDTKLETPNSRRLIEIAKATGKDSGQWYQAIAPHCHHYRAEVDKVILQYPPGTGMLMALLPEETERRWFRFISLFSVTAAFAYLLSRASRAAEGLVVLGGATFVLISTPVGTESAYAGIALSVLCGLLLAPTLTAGGIFTPALLGLVAGFSSVIRITNLLIVAAVGLVFLIRLIRRRTRQDVGALLGFSVASLVGLAPALWGNFVNVGSAFATTYSATDATKPEFDLDGLVHGIAYYFGENSYGLAAIVSLVVGFTALLARPRSVAMLVATSIMVLSLAYMVPRDLGARYYLLPIAGFFIAASTASLVDRREPTQSSTWSTLAAIAFPAGVAAAAAIGLAVMVFPSQRLPINPAIQRQFADDPIVWGDVYGSAVVARYGIYSAKIMFTSPEIQDDLVSGSYDAGIEQFFIDDTESMTAVLQRLRNQWRFDAVGDVFGQPLYRLAGRIDN